MGFFSFFIIEFCIGFTRTEKKYVNVTDDGICNRKTEFKVNKTAYTAKSRHQYYLTHNDFLLHVPNHALKDIYILNYRTFLKIVTIIVPSRC